MNSNHDNADKKNSGKKNGGKKKNEKKRTSSPAGMETMINVSTLSVRKRYLLTLSDKQIDLLVEAAKEKLRAGRRSAASAYDTDYRLPEHVRERLSRYCGPMSMIHDSNDKKWVEYTRRLEGMKFTAPAVGKGDSDVEVYRRLTDECTKAHLPEDFAREMVASIMEYCRTGRMRPILLTGPAGCGKTTGAKLFARILGLPHFLISASRADHSHGIYGESPCFQSPDVGELAKGILENGSLNLVYIVDEIEKAPENLNRSSVADEMLPVCDDSVTEFRDNFLDYELPIHRSPIIMTCNDLDMLSAPLRDRCVIYRFYDVEPPRMRDIIDEYTAGQIGAKYPGILTVDMETVHEAMEELYNGGVRSIRQHRALIDGALRSAYCRVLDTDAPRPMTVPKELLDAQTERLLDNHRKNLGF